MKLLWLARTFPYPAQAGDTIYSRHLIEGCARLGAHIHVICQPGVGDGGGQTSLPGLSWQVLNTPPLGHWRALFSMLPNLAARYSGSKRRHETLEALKEPWDGIVFDSLGASGMFDAVWNTYLGASQRPFFVHISHNHEETTRRTIMREGTNPLAKAVQYLDAIKTGRLERGVVSRCDLLVVNTEEDWKLYQPTHPQVRHVVVRPAYDGARRPHRPLAAVPRSVVVLGSYQWVAKRQNIEAFLEAAAPVFPAAGIGLRVVGFMDAQYRRYLASRFPWAEIVGPVDRVDGELEKARIGIVAELAGGGFKHKLLNYVFGRVTIAALDAAMAGAPLVAHMHYLSAQSVDELVYTIAANIDRIDFLEKMADDAYARCDAKFNWDDRSRDLMAAIEQTAEAKRTVL